MRPEDLGAWKEKRARIVRVAKDEPDMPLCLLAERFGETPAVIRHALQAAGVLREPEYFSDYIYSRRKLG